MGSRVNKEKDEITIRSLLYKNISAGYPSVSLSLIVICKYSLEKILGIVNQARRWLISFAGLTVALLLSSCGGQSNSNHAGISIAPTATTGLPQTSSNTALRTSTAATSSVIQQVFYDGFDANTVTNGGQWEISNWGMGAPFGCGWSPTAVNNTSKGIALNIDSSSGKCGEIRTWKYWQYGSFTANMSPSTAAGTVSSFFLYDGQYGTTSHNEIDMTFIGARNTVHTNYVIAGQQHSLDIDLGARGITAAGKLRNYTIEWTPTSIAWFVNGDANEWIELRRVSAILPASMRLMMNAWRGNNQGSALYFPGPYSWASSAAHFGYVWIGQTPTNVAAPAVPAAVTATPVVASPIPSSPVLTNSTAPSIGTTTATVPTVIGSYPFASLKMYVDPYSAAANYVNSGRSAFPLDVMRKVSAQPSALWLANSNANISSDTYNYVTRARNANTLPVLTLYNIPNRDCGGYSGGGVSAAAYPGWVEQVARGIGQAMAAVILEPDALALIDVAGCLTEAGKSERYQLLKGAITTLKKYAPNTAVYLDAGNSSWIPAATIAQNLSIAGVAGADGFALNVSNFGTTEANRSYGTEVSRLIGNKHFVIDTSRNGNGPTADNQWCNPMGRSLGAMPTGFSSGLIDAYLWVKRPGESDGTCDGGGQAGTFWPQYAYDLATRATW